MEGGFEVGVDFGVEVGRRFHALGEELAGALDGFALCVAFELAGGQGHVDLGDEEVEAGFVAGRASMLQAQFVVVDGFVEAVF